MIYNWLSNSGPRRCLTAGKRIEFPMSENANCCTMFATKHSQGPSLSKNWLFELAIINLETHLRLFLHHTTENRPTEVHCFAQAHKTQLLSKSPVSPGETVVHRQAKIPLTFHETSLKGNFLNVLNNTALIYHLIHIINAMIWNLFEGILSKPIST